MITLLLPTVSRPAMLRTALQSVASQTAVDKIERIFVSENGGNRDSELVCSEFSSLPITYIFRKSTPPLQHAQILMKECLQGSLTAFLHDDDWWAPTHLQYAVAGLEAHPQAGAYGTAHFVVSGESSMLNCSGNLFPWFGANYPDFRPVWEISRSNAMLGLLLGTIAHYSTLVVRTEILKKSAYVYDLNNPFDNDRMLEFAISTFGSLIFNPVPQAFVRNHGIQHCFEFDDEARIKHMCETTRWMVQSSGKSWDFIGSAFTRRMALCPATAVNTLKALAFREWCLPEINRHLAVKRPLAA